MAEVFSAIRAGARAGAAAPRRACWAELEAKPAKAQGSRRSAQVATGPRVRSAVAVAGAGGTLASAAVGRAAPDGYTLLLGTIASHAINPAMKPKMPYDALKDFAPVNLLGSISNVLLVGTDQPYKSVKDLIAAAKAKPGGMLQPMRAKLLISLTPVWCSESRQSSAGPSATTI